MTDVGIGERSEEYIEIAPNCGKKVIYVDGADKVGQNDTLTFNSQSKVLFADFLVDGGSNWVEESTERMSGTANQVKLTNATTGSVYGIAVVEE